METEWQFDTKPISSGAVKLKQHHYAILSLAA